MSKITPATLATTLALATIIFYPSRTLSQIPSGGSSNTPSSGCLSRYSDGTSGDSRPVTRYEFAAGLNTCVNRLNQIIPNRANLATKADFEVLIKRQLELNRQLRELNQRLDKIQE